MAVIEDDEGEHVDVQSERAGYVLSLLFEEDDDHVCARHRSLLVSKEAEDGGTSGNTTVNSSSDVVKGETSEKISPRNRSSDVVEGQWMVSSIEGTLEAFGYGRQS